MDKTQLYREIERCKPQMSAQERMRDYLAGKRVDRIPFSIMSPDGALGALWGYSMRNIRESYEVRREIIARKRDLYGIEGIKSGMGLRGVARSLGSVLSFPENDVDFVSEYACDDYRRFFETCDFDAASNPYMRERLLEACRLQDDFPDMKLSTDVAGPLSTAVALRSFDKVMRDFRRNPRDLHDLLDCVVECSIQWIEFINRETGCTSVSISDPVTSTYIIGRKTFLEFSKPYFQRLMEGIKGITGKYPAIHICGASRGIWDDLVDVGMTSFSMDDCEDLAAANEVMGDKVFLSGNVSPIGVMLKGSVDDVMESVRQTLLMGAGSKSGFMLQTGCQIPIGTPRENIDAFVYASYKYGSDAVIGKIPEAAFEA